MAISRTGQFIGIGAVAAVAASLIIGASVGHGQRAMRTDQHDVSITANMPRGCSYHRIRRDGYADLLLIRCLEGIAFIH